MVVQESEIKSEIISYLRKNEMGASASEIAKAIKYNRITIGKYLQILKAEQILVSKKVASAIYWQLADFSKKFRILIVDDEENIVDLIRLSLNNRRYETYEAFNGKDALEMIQKIVPDLIILDLMMPVIDGITVCKQLKSNIMLKGIPIIILSAKGELKDKKELLDIGVDDYITKPFDPLELEARVGNLLRKKESSFSQNVITGLPSALVTLENKKLWSLKRNWYELKIKLFDFTEFAFLFGHKKSYEVLSLFSRLLISNIKDTNVFVGHEGEYDFVLFSENNLTNFSEKIKNKFQQLVPFIYTEYSDKIEKNKIKIKKPDNEKEIEHHLLKLNAQIINHK